MVPRTIQAPAKAERPEQNTMLFKRILLVADDRKLREEICDLLDLHFYDVTVVTNAAEAIRELMQVDYAVLICDLTMNHFPGAMFYEGVRRVKPDLCKSFISINNASQTSAEATAIGVLRIWKPIDPQILLETISTLLKKRERSVSDASLWDSEI